MAPTVSQSSPPAVQVTGYIDDITFRPIAGARVEALDRAADAFTVTDASGKFSLSMPMTAATTLRATKEGYRPSLQSFQSGLMTFFLVSDRLSGNSPTFTVDADPACTDLPPEARQRTYAATLRGNPWSPDPNTTFFADLTGATLDRYFRSVFITVDDGEVTFNLSDNGIEEEVAPEMYLFVGGMASTATKPGDSTISAPLTGQIDYCTVNWEGGPGYPCSDHAPVRVLCRSNNRLTLRWE